MTRSDKIGGAGVDARSCRRRAGVMMDATWQTRFGHLEHQLLLRASATRFIPLPRVGWGRHGRQEHRNRALPRWTGEDERLADVVMCGRMDPRHGDHVFKGFDRLKDALLLMKEKPRDRIAGRHRGGQRPGTFFFEALRLDSRLFKVEVLCRHQKKSCSAGSISPLLALGRKAHGDEERCHGRRRSGRSRRRVALRAAK